MQKSIKWARILVIAISILLLTTGTAFAAVIEMAVKDDKDNNYVFNYNELIDSYTRNVIGMKSVLYDDFSSKSVTSIATEERGHVDYQDVLNAYTLSVVQGKSFDVVKYIDSSSSKRVELKLGTRAVSVKDDKLVFTALNLSEGDIEAALKAVNDASSVSSMIRALTRNADAFQDGERFKKLHNFAQERVAGRMLARKSFKDADALAKAFKEELQSAEKTIIITYTEYGHTLKEIVGIQVGRNAQTDLYGGGWKSADSDLVRWHVDPNNFQGFMLPAARITASNVNVRSGPSTDYSIVGSRLQSGAGPFYVLNEGSDGNYAWYKILTGTRVGWVREDLLELTTRKGDAMFQFLKLSGNAGVSADEVNENILKGRGTLEGQAEAFIAGSEEYGINEIFLISLALHESGYANNRPSKLAKGYEVDDVDNKFPDKDKVTVYNMYGIGAFDSNPTEAGAQYAYNAGWFSPEEAIIGGARFASRNYIHHKTYQQDTLYKMRWNPASPGNHQYATDVGWATKQVPRIMNLYAQLETYILHFDIPKYK
ncbi:glucosaminidase domain-containing protein [Dethiobacter alkaliphilus]|uniref:glucosaminidase domain-containing protein n=1 Tax=Dethiobacter alkaliphilus TaxID=427926 RepID=UPI0022277145|nr:glucosaminidase domain-containing protein [Dethiobacter alkaliphilus]MCW3488918.1 SH3 domain-containing protein [Dethiobacter alkaliphilus]